MILFNSHYPVRENEESLSRDQTPPYSDTPPSRNDTPTHVPSHLPPYSDIHPTRNDTPNHLPPHLPTFDYIGHTNQWTGSVHPPLPHPHMAHSHSIPHQYQMPSYPTTPCNNDGGGPGLYAGSAPGELFRTYFSF